MLIIEADRIHITTDAPNDWMNTDTCANAVILLIEGASAEMVWTLTPLAVAPFLRNLPDDPSYRAGSAAETFTGIRPVHVGCTRPYWSE